MVRSGGALEAIVRTRYILSIKEGRAMQVQGSLFKSQGLAGLIYSCKSSLRLLSQEGGAQPELDVGGSFPPFKKEIIFF